MVEGHVPTPAFNIRAIISWVVLIAVVLTAVTLFINRDKVLHAVSSDKETVETCTVTKLNLSREFDTDCGRFLWGGQLGDTPYGVLGLNRVFELHATGPRFPIFGLKPTVVSYVEVTSVAPAQ